jgi:hypothetical protein
MAILLRRRILQQVLKAKKEEVFEWSTTKLWHEIKSKCIDVLGSSSSVNHAWDFQPKRWGFLQTLSKIEVGNHKKYEHGIQVSKYDIFKGNFE